MLLLLASSGHSAVLPEFTFTAGEPVTVVAGDAVDLPDLAITASTQKPFGVVQVVLTTGSACDVDNAIVFDEVTRPAGRTSATVLAEQDAVPVPDTTTTTSVSPSCDNPVAGQRVTLVAAEKGYFDTITVSHLKVRVGKNVGAGSFVFGVEVDCVGNCDPGPKAGYVATTTCVSPAGCPSALVKGGTPITDTSGTVTVTTVKKTTTSKRTTTDPDASTASSVDDHDSVSSDTVGGGHKRHGGSSGKTIGVVAAAAGVLGLLSIAALGRMRNAPVARVRLTVSAGGTMRRTKPWEEVRE